MNTLRFLCVNIKRIQKCTSSFHHSFPYKNPQDMESSSSGRRRRARTRYKHACTFFLSPFFRTVLSKTHPVRTYWFEQVSIPTWLYTRPPPRPRPRRNKETNTQMHARTHFVGKYNYWERMEELGRVVGWLWFGFVSSLRHRRVVVAARHQRRRCCCIFLALEQFTILLKSMHP